MREPIPSFKSDEEAEVFVATADLSEYDLTGRFVKFEIKPSIARPKERSPKPPADELQDRAADWAD